LLPLRRNTASDREDRRFEHLDLTPPDRFRAIAGPQNDYFSNGAIETFFNSEYRIGANADRTGMRLEGPRLEHSRSFTSDGIAPGSIQVSGNGQPIVLLADRQTVGGYPKIATVISADLPPLGRIPIGAKIRFAPVTMEEAAAARRKLIADIDALASKTVPIERSEGEFTSKLFDCNLIGGVVDASVGAMERPKLR
jgi:allophanate hydrolase